jgi:hypothetical protein
MYVPIRRQPAAAGCQEESLVAHDCEPQTRLRAYNGSTGTTQL